ncbi:hypothetical protein [Bacteroides ihuae]|uniref:hypothetical protein n=1 Tax=Bacteroides ihuae TaxID=1852362 RepID=UPI0008DB2750|nr:hypothetical protein [Bacteroides ihuae]
MLKDTFFNMYRFKTLCRKEMVESWKVNVLRIALMYGAITIILLFIGFMTYSSSSTSPQAEAREIQTSSLIAFVWFGFIFGCLSASFIMEKMKTKTSRLSALMTPATSFEKFFSRWVVFTVVFMLVFLITFLLADYTRVLICMLSFPEIDTIKATELKYVLVDNNSNLSLCNSTRSLFLLISGYLFFQSCFVLGSSIWPKNAFLKTFVAGIFLVITYSLVGVGLTMLLLGDSHLSNAALDLSEERIAPIASICLACLALFNWTLAYFRFKEAEIINRI